MVMIEGTNISEGRGTALPFQLIGAPYISQLEKLVRVVEKYASTAGMYLRPTFFQPTYQKWAHEPCGGFQLHVTNPHKIRSVPLGLAVIRGFIEEGGRSFAWKNPPYEYDHENNPINLIMGSLEAANRLADKSFDLRDEFWSQGIADYIGRASEILLYKRTLRSEIA
jgi:hypothetical protein